MASKKRQVLVSFVLLCLSTAVTMLLYINRAPTEIEDPVYQPITVDVAQIVKENLRIQVQAQGTVSPLRETALVSEVNGRIVEVSPAFNVGGFVSRDDVLLRIDPRDYETHQLRAEAALATAQSTLAQEKGRSEVAQREWQKLPANSQRSQDAKDLYLRKPQLEQAKAQLLAAQADLQTAKDNLERTIIRAPYDALIRAKQSDLGRFVTTGTPLAEIFSVEAAEIRLPIPQTRLDYLELPAPGDKSPGATIDLYTDVGGELRHWTAQLQRTEGTFDERSRVLYAVARVEDPYALHHSGEPLRIGAFVNANIEGRELTDLVPLPRYVLRAGNLVWVVDETQHLRARKVKLLRTGGDLVYISGGLDNGDLVSLTSLDSSFDGFQVEIKSRTPSNQLDKSGRPKQSTSKGLTEVSVIEPKSEDSSGG